MLGNKQTSQYETVIELLQYFAIIKRCSLNDRCADCGFASFAQKTGRPHLETLYISINHGIFLCARCAQIHQDLLPKEVSDTRPVPSC